MSLQVGIGRVATTIVIDGENTEVAYQGTKVVIFNDDKITLSTGGYFTVTTKRRMNEVAQTFRLGFAVFQYRHDWYVDFQGQRYPFWDGMRLDRKTGKVYAQGQTIAEIPPFTERLAGIVDPR